MKRTSSDLAACAETIGQKKFLKMTSKKRHELLAALALKTISGGDYRRFRSRCARLQSWADLDSYKPPPWLSEKEALQEYLAFHNSFTSSPVLPDDPDGRANGAPLVAWRGAFDVTVMVDQVRSPYNVGSILRIIDNFGLKGLVHGDSFLRMDHPRLCRAARGCENWIPVRFEEDPVSWLTTVDLPVIGIEASKEALSIRDWEPPPACILIVGNEEYGISDAIRGCCERLVRIPMHGYKKSMNVHHALAIAAQKITEQI